MLGDGPRDVPADWANVEVAWLPGACWLRIAALDEVVVDCLGQLGVLDDQSAVRAWASVDLSTFATRLLGGSRQRSAYPRPHRCLAGKEVVADSRRTAESPLGDG